MGLQAFPDFSSNSGTVACIFAFGWNTDGRDLVLRVAHDRGQTGKSLLGAQWRQKLSPSFSTGTSIWPQVAIVTPRGIFNPGFCSLLLFLRLYTIDLRLTPVRESYLCSRTPGGSFALDLRFLRWQISPSVSQNLLLFQVRSRVTP